MITKLRRSRGLTSGRIESCRSCGAAVARVERGRER